MKRSERERLLRAIQPHFPEFTVRGEQMRIEPIGRVIRSVFLDTSAFDKTAFYVIAFFQPLCIPFETIAFMFGDGVRYRGIDGWYSNDPDVVAKLIEALREPAARLASIKSMEDVLRVIESGRETPRQLEGVAIVATALGQVSKAVAAIDRLLPQFDERIDWQRESKLRLEQLGRDVVGDLSVAQARVAQWERETAKSVGVEKFL